MKMYLMIIIALIIASASILKSGNDVVNNQKVVSTNTKVEKSIVNF
jgi:hypothetical protein